MSAPALDKDTAQEILRQAQAVILAQIDVNKAIDAKLTSILQASLNLSVASLGAAAFSLSTQSWLPMSGGIGLGVMGICFAAAAVLAFWALRATNLGAPAIAPAALLDRKVHHLPPQQAFLAIAFDLQKAVEFNNAVADRTVQRMNRVFYTAVGAPILGATAGLIAEASNPRGGLVALAILAGATLAAQAMFRLFGTDTR